MSATFIRSERWRKPPLMAAAEAGIMSIFNGTNTSGASAFATSVTFNCTTTDARTPCVYARMNGYGSTADDTVTVEFPRPPQRPE